MQLHPELRVVWRDSDTLQIGLDPRVAINLTGLTRAEQRFVSFLTTERSEAEMDTLAAQLDISPLRLAEILRFVRASGIVRPPRNERAHTPRPALLSRSGERGGLCVHIAHIDALSVAIALALARAGVGAITFADDGLVTPADHPLLRRRWLGLPRSHAFLTALRQAHPQIRSEGRADCAVVTGSQFLDPETTFAYADANIPHLLAWSEEVDVCVGPLVIPGHSACATCLYKHRVESDSAWRLIAPQALAAAPLPIPPHTANMAGEYGARAILAYLDGHGTMLGRQQWRIPPLPADPYLAPTPAHEECSCTAYSLPAPLEAPPAGIDGAHPGAQLAFSGEP